MEYSQLLKDPRWQKKRLEILNLDNWRCRHCESPDKTLHVHHLFYIKHANPWDYPNSALVTYCEDCHERAPKVTWQQAFLDLNMTEFDLVHLAMCIKFRKQKYEAITDDFRKKHGCRPRWAYMWYSLFETQEEVDEFYTEPFLSHKKYYLNG